ncbi:MBG domain-containing protein [Mucilaginibacter celer]|uniref:Bulb-type lectin domain-containing protein n=1 Tax=Mucilaginibacter celer TaxID=2305508 RepID=A0A494W445_9SPHI|nr:MBG domain-containing protein [Mucilaginibacter celer]AYL98102.1 hypothetical protein HYN43_023685 [Mucilaginibacter celer]
MGTKNLLSLFLFLITGSFVWAQAPVITNYNPTNGVAGTIVTVTGTGFNNAQKLTIGGIPTVILSNTGTQLTAMVMSGTTGGPVELTTSGGAITAAQTFTIGNSFYPTKVQGKDLSQLTTAGQTLKQSYSVAINADGSTILAGNPTDNGEVFVYSRTKENWKQQGDKLTAINTDGSPENFGNAVALSADGNIAIVGAPNHNQKNGAVWIFTRTNNTWQQTGIKLEGTGGNQNGAFIGRSAAISADGKTIIAGGFSAASKNAVWVFTQSDNRWQQSALLEAPDGGKSSKDKQPVALSADGNTVALKGLNASYVFYHAANGWVAQGGSILGNDQTASQYYPDFQITALALNADGNTLITGGSPETYQFGGAWVFVRTAGQWAQQAKLTPSPRPYNEFSRFGSSVSLSADGNTAAIGMPGYNNFAGAQQGGAMMFFTRNGNTWKAPDLNSILYGKNLNTPGGNDPGALVDTVNHHQGFASAISADGRVSIAGSVSNSSDGGCPWIFAAYGRSSQTITFTPPGPVTYGIPDFDPGAISTNKGLPIKYVVNQLSPATMVNGKLHVTGAGNINISASQDNGNDYYGPSTVYVNFTVNKAPLTARPNDTVRIYQQDNPAFTVKYTGLVNGDTEKSFSSFRVSSAAGKNSLPGVYPITAYIQTSNYDVTNIDGKLTVINPPVAFTIAGKHIYGEADFALNATSPNTTQPITFTSSNPAVATIVSNKIHIVGAGTTQITASQATDGYYPAYSTTQPLTVDKAPLTITAHNVSMYAGDAIPTLTATYAGFVNGDGSADLLSAVRFSTSAPATPDAGTYVISLSGATSNNYLITYTSGKLTVTNAIPTITSFSPSTAIEGSVVTITGTNLDKVTSVKFGATNAASFAASSKTTLQAVVGKGASGTVLIVAPGGTATLSGFTFMYTLPQSNFKLTTTGASCNGSINGAVNITAEQTLNYTATITGNGLNTPYTFTTAKTISNLAAGSYNVCITVAGYTDYKQCYDVVITEPKNLSVYAAINPNQDQLNLTLDGGTSYTIKLNGMQYSTTESSINLPLGLGDNEVEVTTDKLCQGIFKKLFSIGTRIIPYPNPFQSSLKLNLGNKNVGSVAVEIHDLADGKLVYLKQYANQSGILNLDLGELKNHVYSLKLTRDGQENIYKILKQQ